MPLAELFKSKPFWMDYFWIEENASYKELCEPILMKLTPDYCFELDTGSDFLHISLALVRKGVESSQLGWDDQVHWHPYVFRFAEYTGFCSIVDLEDWQAALLLSRFVGLDANDKRAEVLEYYTDAWNKAGYPELMPYTRLYQDINNEIPTKWGENVVKGWVFQSNDPDDSYYSTRVDASGA